jgi:ribonuclease HI
LQLVIWPPPDEDQVALNVDGSSYGNPGWAGYGCLIRDHKGLWKLGFSGPVSFADRIEVELLAIQNGLMLAWDFGYNNVSCRSDCKEALSLIQEPVFKPRKYIGIIDSIKELISRDWIVSFALTCREGNQCADFMAKVGANVMDCLRIFPEPPACLGSLLLSDAMRTPYTRFE